MVSTTRAYWAAHGYLLDPHTAVCLAAAKAIGASVPGTVCLATAHPVSCSNPYMYDTGSVQFDHGSVRRHSANSRSLYARAFPLHTPSGRAQWVRSVRGKIVQKCRLRLARSYRGQRSNRPLFDGLHTQRLSEQAQTSIWVQPVYNCLRARGRHSCGL